MVTSTTEETPHTEELDSLSVALIQPSELEGTLADRMFFASPIAKPCYGGDNLTRGEDCQTIEASKSNGWWLSHQPAGYYYVIISVSDAGLPY